MKLTYLKKLFTVIVLFASFSASAGLITIDFETQTVGDTGYDIYGDYELQKLVTSPGDNTQIFDFQNSNMIGDSIPGATPSANKLYGADFTISRTDGEMFQIISLDVLFNNGNPGAVFAGYFDINNVYISVGTWNQNEGAIAGTKSLNSIYAQEFVFTTYETGLLDNLTLKTAEVPEPSTFLILLSGLSAILLRRRKA